MGKDVVKYATMEEVEAFAKKNGWLLVRTKVYMEDESTKKTWLTPDGRTIEARIETDGTLHMR
jgi:hypothetical protein